jgi:hypothetical protein
MNLLKFLFEITGFRRQKIIIEYNSQRFLALSFWKFSVNEKS